MGSFCALSCHHLVATAAHLISDYLLLSSLNMFHVSRLHWQAICPFL